MLLPTVPYPSSVAGAAFSQGLSILAQTILGAIAIVCMVVSGFSVWKLSRVQDKRAEDAVASSGRVEAINDKMARAFAEMTKTLDSLVRAEENGQRLQQDQMNLLQQMKNSLDTTIRDAVLGGRYHRAYPSGSSPPGR